MNRPGPLTRDWNDVERSTNDLIVPWSRRYMQCWKDIGATTISTLGMTAPTTTGTLSSIDDTQGPWLACASATSSGVVAKMETAYTLFRRDWSTSCAFRFRTGNATTSVRYWLGFFSADPSAGATLGTIHAAAFGYDSGVDGTGYWRTITSDGSSQTRTATGSAHSANTGYDFRIDMKAGQVDFYIDGGLVGTHTATLPGSSTTLGWAITATTLAVVTRRVTLGRAAFTHV